VPDEGLPRRARLIKTDDFSSVFNFRKRVAGPYLIIYYRYNQATHPRLGMIVSKKVAASSVKRNYMRRVLREFFRKQQSRLGNVDLVIRVQKSFSRQDFSAIQQEFANLTARLSKIQVRTPGND
jgi:ribonuclease P protein component